MSWQLTGWAVKQRTGSPTRKTVLIALANAASHHTNTCEPHIDVLAEETELSERTVRRALDELAEAGFISRSMKHKANGHRAGYVYSFPRLPDTLSGSAPEPSDGSDLPDTLTAGLPDTLTGQDLREVQEQVDLSPQSPPGRVGQILARSEVRHVEMAVEAWQAHAPPLIAHRESYLAEDATVRAIKRAVKRYGVADVTAAIANYATVLSGDEYRWDYRWTIIDFLKRGLDRFVPEALPLDNFRIRASGEKFGRRDVSAAEMFAAADRLEAERLAAEQADERRALEPG